MIHLWKFAFYLPLPELYFLIDAKAVDFVADVITQVAEVVFAGVEVKNHSNSSRSK